MACILNKHLEKFTSGRHPTLLAPSLASDTHIGGMASCGVPAPVALALGMRAAE